METLSPKGKPIGKLTPGDHPPPPPPKELIGNTFGSPHYQKLFDSLNAAFTNYQVYMYMYITSLTIVHV